MGYCMYHSSNNSSSTRKGERTNFGMYKYFLSSSIPLLLFSFSTEFNAYICQYFEFRPTKRKLMTHTRISNKYSSSSNSSEYGSSIFEYVYYYIYIVVPMMDSGAPEEGIRAAK